MSIDVLANYAEIFGGGAVIVTLIFLGFQVRDNTREQKRRRDQEAYELLMSLSDPFTDASTMPEVLVTGTADYTALSDPDKFRFNNVMTKAVRVLELMDKMRRAGNATAEDRAALERMIYSVLGSVGGRHWWELTGMKVFFVPSTQALVSDLLSSSKGKGYLVAGGEGRKGIENHAY